MDPEASWLRDEGVPTLDFMVRRHNDAVVAFYEQFGLESPDVAFATCGLDSEPG